MVVKMAVGDSAVEMAVCDEYFVMNRVCDE
jgi:hypothetical protein